MKFRFKGLKEYVKKIENLSNSFNAEVCIENALKEGSVEVAKTTKAELDGIHTDDRPGRLDKRNGIRSIEKKFLINEFGLTPLEWKQKINYVDMKTGVDKGRLDYPKSDSYTYAVKLARALEKGTSFLPKDPVFSRGSRKGRKPCLEAMQKSLNEDIERLMVAQTVRLQRRKIDGKW
jgi:hypothetical protein